MNDKEIIDVACREVQPSSQPQHGRLLALLLAFAAPGACVGAAFGKWSGEVAFGLLLVITALALAFGLMLKNGRRISSVFGLTAAIGLAGLALCLVCRFNVWLSLIGLAMAGISVLMLKRIEARGWSYE